MGQRWCGSQSLVSIESSSLGRAKNPLRIRQELSAISTALLAWGLGLAAGAGTANADVCCEPYSDGSCFYYYC
jgi:hypothetical protein